MLDTWQKPFSGLMHHVYNHIYIYKHAQNAWVNLPLRVTFTACLSKRPPGPKSSSRNFPPMTESLSLLDCVRTHERGYALHEGHVRDYALKKCHVRDWALKEGHVRDYALKEGHVRDYALKEGHVRDYALKEGHVRDYTRGLVRGSRERMGLFFVSGTRISRGTSGWFVCVYDLKCVYVCVCVCPTFVCMRA
jgi:hypothetical protein